jgi:outer membrane protein OmpA-like peptidoglycan-associated protein
VRVLGEQPDWKLVVEGHTDALASEAHNLQLSQARAASVVAFLVSRGIGLSRLEAKGLGESQPVADNATELGRARNRRVELVRR